MNRLANIRRRELPLRANDIPVKLIKVFKASNFRFFVIDLKLPAVDLTPEKTLTKKFDRCMNIFYNNPLVELVSTDRMVKLNATGEVVPRVFFNKGKVTRAGSFALFRIK